MLCQRSPRSLGTRLEPCDTLGVTYFADGTPYSYHPAGVSPLILNVGWLDESRPYSIGPVPVDFIRRLIDLTLQPVNLMRGKHWCNLCPALDSEQTPEGQGEPGKAPPAPPDAVCRFEGEEWTVGGNGEIRVAEPDGTRWVAPRLILHYVLAHSYQPPTGFLTAVMLGTPLPDPQDSAFYK